MKFENLFIAGGKIPPVFFVKKLVKLSKNIITVDRGAELALKLKLKPLLHVGDNDSLTLKNLAKLKSQATVQLPTQKSVSDLEFALRHLLEKSKNKIKPSLVIGAHREFELRHDHAFINMRLLQDIENLYFVDEKNWITLLPRNKSFLFSTKKGTLFSLVPLQSRKNKIRITGAKYQGLIDLKTVSHGLSNVAMGPVRLKTRSKILLFVSAPLTHTKIDASLFNR